MKYLIDLVAVNTYCCTWSTIPELIWSNTDSQNKRLIVFNICIPNLWTI